MVTQLVLGAQIYWGNMLFYILSFVILMALILKFAWNPIVKMLDERASKIANDIDSAEQSRTEAAKLAADNKAALADSRSKASDIMTTAKQNGEQERSKIVANAQDEATQYKQQARKDIEQERQDALKNAQSDVADLSIEIASKIIQKELKPADQQALIDSYIEGLGKHES